MRFLRFLSIGMAVMIAIFCGVLPASAQTDSGTIAGRVTDSSGAVIVGAQVILTNIDRGTVAHASTNGSGIYVLPSVSPGRYNLSVSHAGFREVDLTNIVVNVQSNIEQNFKLSVGSVSESVTVNGGGESINTTDASVGTVVDRQFVENIPMNGRSFQSLVLLSPGTVTNTPQDTSPDNRGNDYGEYSVNGMRTTDNSFSVDGASVNNAAGIESGADSAGMEASVSALGTTQAMLSLDAMEEFRISTSTYSAEFGRQPGAQVSFRSRSGTNEYHGEVFNYLRNSAFDANNWFNTYSNPPIPTPAERQNDFGGTLGGPISIPHLYSGKDRAFFFFSYEGLRLTVPGAATVIDVPSNGTYNTGTYANPKYKNLREYAPAALQQLLNSFPAPNCDTSIDAECVDYGDGGSPYLYTPQNAGTINSISARVDYQVLPSMRVFARYSDVPSNTVGNYSISSNLIYLVSRNRTYLLGADNTFKGTISNELRLQYAPAFFEERLVPIPNAPGATANINLYEAQGLPADTGGESRVGFDLPSSSNVLMYQISWGSKQFQPNATDSVTWTHGKHLFKAGVDYRQTTAYYGLSGLSRGPEVSYIWTSPANVLANKTSTSVYVYDRTDPTSKNLGLFLQDEWRVHPRLSLSLGLRWDLAPPPTISGAQLYTYTGDINNPSSLGLSARGASLYNTTYHDFAPRFGLAYDLYNVPGHELVLRAGGGLFYNSISLMYLLQAGTALGAESYKSYSTPFPLEPSQILLPVSVPPTPPYSIEWYPARNLVPPSAIQWNVTLEQALGENQSVSMGYVASVGRNLETEKEYSLSKLNPEFGTMVLFENGPGSTYNSLQVKYQRRMSHGLQALASYTWSHFIDWASTNASVGFPLQKGNSDQDVRHNFSGALVYNLPTQYNNPFAKAILGYWSADLLLAARTAFPYEPTGAAFVDPATGQEATGQLNYNGKYPYVHKPGIPGGRQINPAVFSLTTSTLGIGNAPRNFLRGFGEDQENVSIQRNFPIVERMQLLFRAEAFNIFNHPTFGTINTTCDATTAGSACTNPLMGQAENTLSVGLGGLSSLYQQGGPRSLQFALKLQF